MIKGKTLNHCRLAYMPIYNYNTRIYAKCQAEISIYANGGIMVEKIRTIARKKNLTLTELERRLGFGQGTIRRWDEKKPAIDKVILLCDLLEIPIEMIIEGSKFTDEERELIELYRSTDTIGKESIISAAKFQAARAAKQDLKPFA